MHTQDRVANKAKDIAGLILGRKMVFPALLVDDFTAYIERSVAASKQARDTIQKLGELLEVGFRGKEVDFIEEMIDTLDQLEHETDDIQRALRLKLFALEKQLPPIDVMFTYKVIDKIGELADQAQAIGGRLQLILAH